MNTRFKIKLLDVIDFWKNKGLVHVARTGLKASASLFMGVKEEEKISFFNSYKIDCFDRNGKLKWSEEIPNTVVNEGLNYALNAILKGGSQESTWVVGLTDGTPTINAADVVESHAGWVEVTDYAGNRKALTLGSVSSQSVDNVGNVAAFAINNTVTVGGAFVASADGDSAGVTLYGVATFSGGDRSAVSGDTINVTVTLTAASA